MQGENCIVGFESLLIPSAPVHRPATATSERAVWSQRGGAGSMDRVRLRGRSVNEDAADAVNECLCRDLGICVFSMDITEQRAPAGGSVFRRAWFVPSWLRRAGRRVGPGAAIGSGLAPGFPHVRSHPSKKSRACLVRRWWRTSPPGRLSANPDVPDHGADPAPRRPASSSGRTAA